MRYREMYAQGAAALEEAGVREAALDARLLLEEACGTDRTTLYAHGERELGGAEEKQYRELIERRARRIPLQHILGRTEFMGLTFLVNSEVLCPRPDTEVLVEEVLKYVHDGMRILDIGTGSGCILLSLLHYSNDCMGVGVDISGKALRLAKENAARLSGGSSEAARNGLSAQIETAEGGLAERAAFIEGSLFEKIEGKFEIIVSNPPYIRSGEIAGLMPEVRDHEPHLALDGGEDGLRFYREITERAKEYLAGGGMLFYEIGFDQGEAVKEIMGDYGFREVEIVKDFSGLDRVIFGTLY